MLPLLAYSPLLLFMLFSKERVWNLKKEQQGLSSISSSLIPLKPLLGVGCSWGIGSLITIPLWAGLATQKVGQVASSAKLMGSTAIAETSSLALENEEDSSSFINLLLLVHLSLGIGEKIFSFLFFFLSSPEGLDFSFLALVSLIEEFFFFCPSFLSPSPSL